MTVGPTSLSLTELLWKAFLAERLRQIISIATITTAHSRMSPPQAGWSQLVGDKECALATTTTMDGKTSTSLITEKIASTITIKGCLPKSAKRQELRELARRGGPVALLSTTTVMATSTSWWPTT